MAYIFTVIKLKLHFSQKRYAYNKDLSPLCNHMLNCLLLMNYKVFKMRKRRFWVH